MSNVRTRIGLAIQYDGTDFCGWAEQAGRRTVQGTLKTCIESVCNHAVELRGASRTDSGAHALGQFADFETDNPMPATRWATALNDRLPLDVTVARSKELPSEFHSRFFARSRTYRYRISEEEKVSPMMARFVYASSRKMDELRMAEAARLLVGRHDFLAFGEELPQGCNTVREVFACSVFKYGREVRITIRANAFIRGMVRRIAGGLFEVGVGRRSRDEFASLLDTERRAHIPWPVVLPARGLTLLRVDYGWPYRDLRQDQTFEED